MNTVSPKTINTINTAKTVAKGAAVVTGVVVAQVLFHASMQFLAKKVGLV